jgi:mRNA interferase RelE/StbE
MIGKSIDMADVSITDEARVELERTPLPIQNRAIHVLERLANWPHISGARPLRGKLKGNFRIRTGDYRILFSVSPDGQTVKVWKIGYRGDIYD